ncbi:MAG: DUF2149 domain-containing protein [Solirubrobacterales bacterium]
MSAGRPSPRRGGAFVTPRARRRPDRAGDPLDGLVNLFDLGIVLAVAFLLAALSSLKLSDLLTSKDVTVVHRSNGQTTVVLKHGQKLRSIRLTHQRVAGTGQRIGTAFRLSDGRIVLVRKPR